jgi:predicted amidophosphoribosyltransferase
VARGRAIHGTAPEPGGGHARWHGGGMTLADALLDALAVLLPVECAGCGAPDRSLCPACALAVQPRPASRVLTDGTVVVSALEYDGAVRSAILGLKEHGRTDVARRLAVPLRSALDAVPRPAARPLGVPSSRAAMRRRGYDPVALLLRHAGVSTSRLLAITGAGAQQKSLGIEARSANRAGRMRARRPLDGRSFVLVDDVITTGATLVEAARAVRSAGGEVAGAVTLAHTPRRMPHPGERRLNGS